MHNNASTPTWQSGNSVVLSKLNGLSQEPGMSIAEESSLACYPFYPTTVMPFQHTRGGGEGLAKLA